MSKFLKKIAELTGSSPDLSVIAQIRKKKAITVSCKALKRRNPLAASAWNRSGSGRHPDKKKKNNKLRCRGKVKQ